jgi:predicted nucleic acid-binding protein
MVDTSCLVALAFGEPAATRTLARMRRFDRLFASALLEAELLAALRRERVDADIARFTADLSLVSPDRPLTRELVRASAAGYLRGADLWHIGCALFLSPDTGELTFLTLDRAQRVVARALGFEV